MAISLKVYKCTQCVRIYKMHSTCASANHHIACKAAEFERGYSISRHNLAFSTNGELPSSTCLPVIEVKTCSLLACRQSVNRLLAYHKVSGPCSTFWVGQTFWSIRQKLDTARSFCLQLLPRRPRCAVSQEGRTLCCDAASSRVHAFTTFTPMLLHVPATDRQIASMDMSGTSCCFC